MKSPLKFFFILNLLIPLVGCSGLTHAPTQYSNQKDLKAAIRAVQNQDLNNLRSIISKNNAILNGMEDSKGNTLLDIAVLKGTLEIVEYLVSAGANVNYRNSSDGTPLIIAIKNEKFDLIAYLLNQGANVNLASQFNDTPLHTAVGRGELEIVKLIVSHGADLNVKNNNKETPLLIALENNYSEIAEYLISKDANVNIKNQGGKYPLHIAAYNGNLEVAKRLVSRGAEINATDIYDITPLHDAASNGQLEIVKYLVSHGANVNVKGASLLEWSPIHRTLGCTPLHLAANKSHLEIERYLISEGADIEAKNNEDETALDLARKRKHQEIVAFLESSERLIPQSKPTKMVSKTPVKKAPPEEFVESKPRSYPDIDFGKYFALVIGNNNYLYLPQLKTAQNDARDVAETLKSQYGFEVQLLLDADRSDILLALSNLRWNLNSNDNLLIYYAGHGWLDKDADEGYWLPVNAQKDNMLAWISNSSITAILRALKAKHVLIVADSCYSGKLARGVNIVNKPPGYLSRLSRTKARCVISSGGLEPVIDSGGDGLHSVFAAAFLSALKENNDILDGEQLFNKLRRPVMLNSDQTPQYSDIRKAGHEGGEFLFVKKR
jgi:ankyrin repeat protein/uncharacterized caspase-like protein